MIIVGGVIYFISTKNQKENNVKPTIDEVIEASVDVSEIATNLADKSYIKIELKIQTDSKESAEELLKREFQTKNILIQELSELKKSDLEGKSGKTLLLDNLKVEINNILNDGEVTQIYITSYIVQ